MQNHSTETALLCVHDHFVNAVCSQQVSHVCLLDLSAAFDTSDHSILPTRLSCWSSRIHDLALSWIRNYLSSRSTSLNCSGLLSSPQSVSCGVPHGSRLGSLLSLCTLACNEGKIRCEPCSYESYGSSVSSAVKHHKLH